MALPGAGPGNLSGGCGNRELLRVGIAHQYRDGTRHRSV